MIGTGTIKKSVEGGERDCHVFDTDVVECFNKYK
jgi:hypothetical protein